MKKEVRFRLIKHITFFENELKDYKLFETLSWKNYGEDRSMRRDAERWAENIINSSIDITKIILTSEGLAIPDTYKDIVTSLSRVPDFDKLDTEKLSGWVKLRNIISHEYLDIRWSSIRRFISETEPLYKDFLNKIKEYLNKRMKENKEVT